MKSLRKVTLAALLIVGVLSTAAFLTPGAEFQRFADPSGRYTAVVTSKWYQRSPLSLPGQARDRSGFIRIEDKSGRSYGTLKTPMIWMAGDIRWEDNGAHLIGVGSWNFITGECTPWE